MLLTLLFADTDAASITPVISALGSLGFAIWFAWYTVTVTLPKQQVEHREERAAVRGELLEMLNRLVDEMKQSREAYDRWKSDHKG